jgi:hypothetical protein
MSALLLDDRPIQRFMKLELRSPGHGSNAGEKAVAHASPAPAG